MACKLKRLIWYVNSQLSSAGGGERLLLEGLNHFANVGIETALFTAGYPVTQVALFNGAYKPKHLSLKEEARFLKKISKLPIIGKLIRLHQIRQTLKAFDPDIVVANGQYEAVVLWILKLSGLKPLRFVCFIHGSFFQFADDIKKYMLVYKLGFRKIWENDHVYRTIIPLKPHRTISIWIRLKTEVIALLEWFGVRAAGIVFVLTKKNKVEVEILYGHAHVLALHGAFPRSIFDLTQNSDKKTTLGIADQKMIFSVCRLVKKKQVDLIISGFALFAQRRSDAILVVGGIGEDEKRLRTLAQEAKIDDKIIFAGFIPEAEIYDYYRSCDLFITADNADYDITTFMALALGAKVVASAQHEFDPAIKQLGLLFEAKPSAEDFARAFDEAFAEEKKASAQERKLLLDSYTWEYYFSQILASILELF
jgi:glycosyltransferase involved in cell wall biosynthesis